MCFRRLKWSWGLTTNLIFTLFTLTSCLNPASPVEEGLSVTTTNPSSLAGITWLSPVVTGEIKPDTPFDPLVDLSVQVYQLQLGRPIGEPLGMTFRISDGSIDLKDEHYQFLLHTRQLQQNDDSLVRIEVRLWNAPPNTAACSAGVNLEASGCLAYLDVHLVANRGRSQTANKSDVLTIVNGQTLPIKLHIAQGVINILNPKGGLLTGPDGLLLGLPAQPTTTPIMLDTTTNPDVPSSALPHAQGTTVESSLFLLTPSKSQDIRFPAQAPLIVGIPVPPSAPTDHLSLAVLSTGKHVRNNEPGLPFWLYLPGKYDAELGLFIAPLVRLESEGTIVAVVSGQDFHSPIQSSLNSALMTANTQTSQFSLSCRFLSSQAKTSCEQDAPALQNTFEASLNQLNSMSFRPPVLEQSLDCNLVGQSVNCVFQNIYVAKLHGNGDPYCANLQGNPILGYYDSPFMVICYENGTLDVHKETAVHELFHAIQAAYNLSLQDHWLIEGTAELAAATLMDGLLTRSNYQGFRNVSHSLTQPCPETLNACGADYQAQDFFAFLIRRAFGTAISSLSYLNVLFEEIELVPNNDAFIALDATVPPPFSSAADAYWQWVKNQAYERTTLLGYDGNVQPCSFIAGTVTSNLFVYDFQDEITKDYFLPPLSATWIDIGFFAEGEAEFAIQTTDDAIVSKFYLEGEDCVNEGVEAEKRSYDIKSGDSVFILIANTSNTTAASVGVNIIPVDDIDDDVSFIVRIGRRPQDPKDLRILLTGGIDTRLEVPEFTYDGCSVSGGTIIGIDQGNFTQQLMDSSGSASSAGGISLEVTKNLIEITMSGQAAAAPTDQSGNVNALAQAVLLFLLEVDNPKEHRVTVTAEWEVVGAGSTAQNGPWTSWFQNPGGRYNSTFYATTPLATALFHVYNPNLHPGCRRQNFTPGSVFNYSTFPLSINHQTILGDGLSLRDQTYEFLIDAMAGATASTRIVGMGDPPQLVPVTSGAMSALSNVVIRFHISWERRP